MADNDTWTLADYAQKTEWEGGLTGMVDYAGPVNVEGHPTFTKKLARFCKLYDELESYLEQHTPEDEGDDN